MFPVFRTPHVHGAHIRSQWPFYESMALCRSSQLWRSTEQLCSLWELHLYWKHCWRVWCCHGVHIFPWVSKCRKHQTLWNRRLVSVFATDWWYQYLTNVHFVNCSFMKLIIISQHPAVNRFHLGVKSTHQKRISVMNSDKSCWWSFVNSKCGNHFGIDFLPISTTQHFCIAVPLTVMMGEVVEQWVQRIYPWASEESPRSGLTGAALLWWVRTYSY